MELLQVTPPQLPSIQVTPLISPSQDIVPITVEDSQKILTTLTSGDATQRNSYAQIGFNPDTLLREKGWAGVDQMMTWGGYAAPMNIKREAVTLKGWEIKATHFDEGDARRKKAVEAASFCRDVLHSIYDDDSKNKQSFSEVLWEMTMAFHRGFSCFEKTYRIRDSGESFPGKYGLKSLVPRPPRQLGFYLDRKTLAVRLIRSYAAGVGWEVMSPEKAMIYTYRPTDGLPYGQGDWRSCFKWVWAADGWLRQWGIGLQRFGMPFLMATVDNPDPVYVKSVQQHMDNIQQGASAVFPSNVVVQITQAAGGSIDGFEKAMDCGDRKCAEIILGQSLTTHQGQGHGSYSLGQVQVGTQEYRLRKCREDIANVITDQLLLPLVVESFGEEYAECCPSLFLGVWDAEERLLLANFYKTLTEIGAVNPSEPVVRNDVGLDPMEKQYKDEMNAAKAQEAEKAVAATEDKKPADSRSTKKPVDK